MIQQTHARKYYEPFGTNKFMASDVLDPQSITWHDIDDDRLDVAAGQSSIISMQAIHPPSLDLDFAIDDNLQQS